MRQFLPDAAFWQGRRVFITGHTGFKGSWLSQWLLTLGSKVKGYSLAPDGARNIFESLALEEKLDSTIADILDADKLSEELAEFRPEVIFHLAAQPIVLDSYADPVKTFATNAIGTANLLNACRSVSTVKAILIVTTDKVYQNVHSQWALRENDQLGGNDPYSASKACAEIITHSFKRSFFEELNVSVATARAGNVFGGGDWSPHRIVPDAVQAFEQNEHLRLRNPSSIRPWQFVLEPLAGYLMLAKACVTREEFSGGWNFGPNEGEVFSVANLADALKRAWGGSADWKAEPQVNCARKESELLILNTGYAARRLGWKPQLSLDEAVQLTIEWYKCCLYHPADLIKVTQEQIDSFSAKLLMEKELCVFS